MPGKYNQMFPVVVPTPPQRDASCTAEEGFGYHLFMRVHNATSFVYHACLDASFQRKPHSGRLLPIPYEPANGGLDGNEDSRSFTLGGRLFTIRQAVRTHGVPSACCIACMLLKPRVLLVLSCMPRQLTRDPVLFVLSCHCRACSIALCDGGERRHMFVFDVEVRQRYRLVVADFSMQTTEKNWAAFEYEEALHVVCAFHPLPSTSAHL